MSRYFRSCSAVSFSLIPFCFSSSIRILKNVTGDTFFFFFLKIGTNFPETFDTIALITHDKIRIVTGNIAKFALADNTQELITITKGNRNLRRNCSPNYRRYQHWKKLAAAIMVAPVSISVCIELCRNTFARIFRAPNLSRVFSSRVFIWKCDEENFEYFVDRFRKIGKIRLYSSRGRYYPVVNRRQKKIGEEEGKKSGGGKSWKKNENEKGVWGKVWGRSG